MLIETLKLVGQHLNKENIRWGIGASVMLFAHDIVQTPRDIDILVHIEDVQKTIDTLSILGKLKPRTPSNTCKSKAFYEFTINEIDVEIMGGFTVKHSEGTYIYEFNNNSAPEFIEIDNIQLPLMTVEDWYIIYQVLPNRETKVQMIEEYLSTKGIKYMYHIQRQLNLNLPKNVIKNTNKFILDL
jgi:hypothetical protein